MGLLWQMCYDHTVTGQTYHLSKHASSKLELNNELLKKNGKIFA